jgi:hypothetical protein
MYNNPSAAECLVLGGNKREMCLLTTHPLHHLSPSFFACTQTRAHEKAILETLGSGDARDDTPREMAARAAVHRSATAVQQQLRALSEEQVRRNGLHNAHY